MWLKHDRLNRAWELNIKLGNWAENSLSLRVKFFANNKLYKSAFLKLSVIMSDLSLFKIKSTSLLILFFNKSKDLTVFQNKLRLQLSRDFA